MAVLAALVILFLTVIFAALTVGKLTDEWNPSDQKQEHRRWLEARYRSEKPTKLW